MINIYPSYTLIFIMFNLLGWWYKGQPFFSWWWIIPVIIIQILIEALTLSIMKKLVEIKD